MFGSNLGSSGGGELERRKTGVLFSSRGTRWQGFVVEKVRRWPADFGPCAFDASEPRASYLLTKTEISWETRGTRHKRLFTPEMAVFLNKGYRLDELTAQADYYDAVSTQLERKKIDEMIHDDVRSSRVDFLEHVISNDGQMIGMLSAMLAEASAGSPAGALFSQSISIAFLTHILDRYDRARSARRLQGRLSPRQDKIIIQYVRERIGCDMSITELASVLQLSPAYFCKAFSKSHGVTPHRFILNQRIGVAMERLRQPSPPPLADLASSLGFADRTHFSQVFRKIVGRSPSEFRGSPAIRRQVNRC
jgi:AraC family transcriptional regulator